MLLAMPAMAAPAAGQASPAPAPSPAPVDVIEVGGRIDAIEASFLARSIRSAESAGSQLLVVQLDSPGSILSGQKLDELAFRIAHAAVPVAVWVGPSGARAYGGAVRLLEAAAVRAMANGTTAGRFHGSCTLCPPGVPLLTGAAVTAGRALDRHGVDIVTPTLGDLVVELDGRQVGGRTLQTAKVVERDGQPRREPTVEVRFAKLAITERALHATTTPSIAYLMLVLGLLLIVFEFYSAGVGVVGLCGGVSLVLAAYGLAALDVNLLGLVLVVLGVFGFSVDVQAGAPRVWTVIGTVALSVGSWVLLPADRRPAWLAVVLVVAGTVVFMLRGMTVMVRTRFSTSAINRAALVGEVAEATTPLAPDGVVRVRGAHWRARADEAVPIEAGGAVRVTGIDGVFLRVAADVPGAGSVGSETD
jgi:membrane-bound serine protease (ClpP class)